jgi:hypothetical protein
MVSLRTFIANGQNLTNTVSLSSNSDKGGFNLSIADARSEGITPNNSFNRKTINLGLNYDLSSKLNVKANVNYSFEKNTNPPVVSDQTTPCLQLCTPWPIQMPLYILDENKYNAGGGEYLYSRFTNRTNPYWGLAEVKGNIRRDRIFVIWRFVTSLQTGSRFRDVWVRTISLVNLTIEIFLRVGFHQCRVDLLLLGTCVLQRLYTQDFRTYRELNTDFLLTAIKDWGDFGINVNAGGNQLKRKSDVSSVQVTDFSVLGLYNVGYGRAKDPTTV